MIGDAILLLKDCAEGRCPRATWDGVFAECLFDALLGPAESGSEQRDAGDSVVPPGVLDECLSQLPLTQGARDRLAGVNSLYDVVTVVFADKQFRSTLREIASRRSMLKEANRAIALASRLGESLRPPLRKASESPMAVVREPLKLAPPAGETVPDGLREWWAHSFPVKGRHKTYQCRFGEFANDLRTGANPGASREIMRALAQSDYRMGLLLLHRACERGAWDIAATLRPHLAAEAARILSVLNANRSACSMGMRLLDDAASLKGLKDTDRLSLMTLAARAALRSGNREAGNRLYRRAFHEFPGRGDTLANYLSTVFSEDAATARTLAGVALVNNPTMNQSEVLLVGEFFRSDGKVQEATAMFCRAAVLSGTRGEHLPGLANLALDAGNREEWLQLLGMYGAMHGLDIDGHDPGEPLAPFSLKGGGREEADGGPLVSVIMTCFNGAEFVAKAAASVLAQDFANIELIIVDDVSTDGSRTVITDLARRDRRVSLLFNDQNMGTYASKNRAIERAKGSFLAFHDSDDWMHPSHVRRHVGAMGNGAACSTSNWLRMTAEGQVMLRRSGGYVHLNPASTLFRRDLVAAIGPFDSVRTGADSEFLMRIRLRYGWNAILHLPECLALGLHHGNSLTQAGATAFDEHRYSAVRLDYTEAWLERALQWLEARPHAAVKGVAGACPVDRAAIR